jgi:hypothetical protein
LRHRRSKSGDGVEQMTIDRKRQYLKARFGGQPLGAPHHKNGETNDQANDP